MIAVGDFTRFELTHDGEPLGHFEVPLYGQHNVRNALAALAVGQPAAAAQEDFQSAGLVSWLPSGRVISRGQL